MVLLLENAMQCTVLPHITARVFINDDEYGLYQDYEKWLEELPPHAPSSQYLHNRTEDNAGAHLRRQIMDPKVVVAVTNGRLDNSTDLAEVLGTWQRIFFGEFDGRRRVGRSGAKPLRMGAAAKLLSAVCNHQASTGTDRLWLWLPG